jgi:urea transporter
MTTDTNVNAVRIWSDPADFLRVVLRGIGQVMFQDHAGTGLLFLIGIAVMSPLMAVGSIIGAIIGPVVASFARFDQEEIDAGIHGFNPVLVGCGLMAFLQPVVLTWVLVVVGCVAATFVTYWMRKYLKFPTYTAPFVVTTWLLIMIAHAIAGKAIDVVSAAAVETPIALFQGLILKGVSQVFFMGNPVAGILMLAGIALSNWRHAVIALLGSVVGTLLGVYHNNPDSLISIGVYGYNASLAAMAIYLWRKSLLLPILAAAISIPLTEFFPTLVGSPLGIPTLTATFVMATWIVLAIGQLETVFVREKPSA